MPSFGLYRGDTVEGVLGVLRLRDMRADTFFNVRMDEKNFEVIKGSDGSLTRYCTQNTLGYVDFTAKRSSNEHQRLSALHNADLITPGGAGVVSFLLKDLQGATLLAVERAWITGFPDAGFAKDVGADVTWEIAMQVLAGSYIIGGNQIS
jgi:hypothetical protein